MADRKRAFGNRFAALLGNLRQPSLVVLLGVDGGRVDIIGGQVLSLRRQVGLPAGWLGNWVVPCAGLRSFGLSVES